MKINKQLFEDVLSGKLKGTFVLRNKSTLHSSNLRKIAGTKYQYVLCSNSYTSEGMLISNNKTHPLNIEDFIPETNMKENELTIEIPNGKIVDWDESKKQNKIVLKDKQLTYKDVCEKSFKNKKIFYTGSGGDINIVQPLDVMVEWLCNKNNATTEHQLECILAKNQLANVAKYLNGEWQPTTGDTAWYIISYGHNNIDIVNDYFQHSHCSSRIIFKTKGFAQQAIEILGEEIVKLALEPLGI